MILLIILCAFIVGMLCLSKKNYEKHEMSVWGVETGVENFSVIWQISFTEMQALWALKVTGKIMQAKILQVKRKKNGKWYMSAEDGVWKKLTESEFSTIEYHYQRFLEGGKPTHMIPLWRNIIDQSELKG